MKNVPAVAEAVASGDAMFGTVDSWLVYHLSVRGNAHAHHLELRCFCGLAYHI